MKCRQVVKIQMQIAVTYFCYVAHHLHFIYLYIKLCQSVTISTEDIFFLQCSSINFIRYSLFNYFHHVICKPFIQSVNSLIFCQVSYFSLPGNVQRHLIQK